MTGRTRNGHGHCSRTIDDHSLIKQETSTRNIQGVSVKYLSTNGVVKTGEHFLISVSERMTRPDPAADKSSKPKPQGRFATRSSLIRDLKLDQVSEERWREFELIYKPLLKYWITRKSVPESATEEVLQECWVSIFKAIGKFEHGDDKGTFRGWLRTIVQRRAADYFRSLPKDQGVSPEQLHAIATPVQKDEQEIDGELQALREIETRALEVIRSKTNEQTWKMFWMRVVEKRSAAEVAKNFGVSEAAVRMAKQRVLKRFAELGFEV